MAALTARSCFQNFRCSIRQLGLFPAARLVPHGARLGESRAAHLLTRVPKTALLCWVVGRCMYTAASCQEALLPQPKAEKKAIAKVQVHKLVFVLRLTLRAVVLLVKFGPLLLLFPLSLVSEQWASHWLDALLWVTETSGPTFIKLGQWASTRRDIFSQAFCDRFSRLHVHVCPHAWTHTKACLKRAFGEHWRQLFVFDSKEPVGSGCIAQVYQAKARVEAVEDPDFQQLVEDLERDDLLEAWEIPGLRRTLTSLQGIVTGEEEQQAHQTGQEKTSEFTREGPGKEHLIPVAIKVLHPGIRRQVEIDLLLMKAGSWLLNCLPGVKWLSLPGIVEEFGNLMTKQIDLRYEAKNIEKFRENFRDVHYVKFPIPLRPFVTRTVLVETYEESEPISRYLQGDVPMEVKQRIARMGVDTLLKMVFVDNFVHGDLHPGNILVQWNQSGSAQDKATLTDLWDTVVVSVRPAPPPLQLVLLDAGIVAHLSDGDLRNFRAVFTAVVLRQGERVAELILHHARANECQDVPRFKREMAQLVDQALSDTLSLGKVQVAELLSRVFGLLIHHKVKLESNFASIVFAIMVLEGLGRSLDPNLDILEIAKPLLLKNCASLL
ncbi:hypothetical protein AALO_G00158500 [Alosa alosa]|uniref:ABC1 atypical kinase-like domain-containing protein n=1 Tax=Alosa alosa TaxID=278164 RepID=A0AAV6GK20_9TELE|nr:uncharacterized aarF domain-containing protein kinase 2 [Alosa alosa]KAG5274040.1 hypothetical protein AALO_G00158500 [Alosa alosa]